MDEWNKAFFEMARAYVSQMGESSVKATVTSNDSTDKPSAHLYATAGSWELDLIVWETGECEYHAFNFATGYSDVRTTQVTNLSQLAEELSASMQFLKGGGQ